MVEDWYRSLAVSNKPDPPILNKHVSITQLYACKHHWIPHWSIHQCKIKFNNQFVESELFYMLQILIQICVWIRVEYTAWQQVVYSFTLHSLTVAFHNTRKRRSSIIHHSLRRTHDPITDRGSHPYKIGSRLCTIDVIKYQLNGNAKYNNIQYSMTYTAWMREMRDSRCILLSYWEIWEILWGGIQLSLTAPVHTRTSSGSKITTNGRASGGMQGHFHQSWVHMHSLWTDLIWDLQCWWNGRQIVGRREWNVHSIVRFK